MGDIEDFVPRQRLQQEQERQRAALVAGGRSGRAHVLLSATQEQLVVRRIDLSPDEGKGQCQVCRYIVK